MKWFMRVRVIRKLRDPRVIDWESEVESVETEIDRTLRLALAVGKAARHAIVILEEVDEHDSTCLNLLSTTMTTNEEVGLLMRAVCFAMEGNELDGDGRRKGEADEEA